MAVKINIRKIAAVTVWGLVGAGILVLLVAAVRYRNNNTCKGLTIEIGGPTTGLFIDKKGISDLLGGNGVGKVQGRSIQSFDLRRLESVLENNVWLKKGHLFFDNNR